MFNSSALMGPILAVLLGTAAIGYAGDSPFIEVPVDPAAVLDQMAVSKIGCGPTAILHSLRFGNDARRAAFDAVPGDGAEKIKLIMDVHARKPSGEYQKGERLRGDGIACRDLTDMMNEVLAEAKLPAVEGIFLNREKHETPEALLRRVHGRMARSLEAGVPVIVSLRTFAAQPDRKKADGYSWHGLHGHYIVVTRIPRELSEFDRGFPFTYLNSDPGKMESGYIYAETVRGFCAIRGNDEDFEWLEDSPFLLITAPKLKMKTQNQPWWARTTITLNFGLFAPDVIESPASAASATEK